LKHILIIAFIYPPLGGSGVQRTLKFSKYLPEFGWKPYIVCGDDPDIFGDGLDHSLLAEIPPQALLWRKPFVSPLGLRRRIHQALHLGTRKDNSQTSRRQVSVQSIPVTPSQQKPDSSSQQTPSSTPTHITTLRRLFDLLSIPLRPFEFPPVDAALYWSLAILPGCLRMIRKEKIDLIFSTSFPYSDHLTGLLLNRLTGVPWVADFRDPWTQNASARNQGWRYRVDQWVERKVLQSADRIIGVTPGYTRGLSSLAPKRSSQVFQTIENGYDPIDLPHLHNKPDNSSKTLVLAHVGFLYNGTGKTFLEALEILGEQAENLSIRFIGGLAPIESAWLECHHLTARLEIHPRRSHNEAIRAMQEANLLLLFIGAGTEWQGHYPGKIFEYMASGTPILLIGPQGDSAQLLERSGTGICLPAADRTSIAVFLKSLLQNPEEILNSFNHPQPEVIAGYERRRLTNRLADLFDEIVENPTKMP
jgi:glycosyltransferase involved in cell wall biosynthesis